MLRDRTDCAHRQGPRTLGFTAGPTAIQKGLARIPTRPNAPLQRVLWWCVILISLGSACAAPTTPPAATGRGPATTPSAAAEPAPGFDPTAVTTPAPEAQALRESATFLDLLRALQANEGRPPGPCLLRRAGGGFAVGAGATLATRGWPEAPANLTPPDSQAQLRVLTRWGQIGDATHGPVLVGVTAVPPLVMHGPALGILIDRARPIQLVPSDGQASEATADIARVGTLAVAAAARGVASFWLAATRDTPVSTLVAVMRQLPAGPAVGLAIALPTNTRMPTPPPGGNTPPSQSQCLEGLPAPADEEAEGDLPRDALVAALEPLQQNAAECLGSASGPAAVGGHVTLALRIGPHGTVREACLVEDGIGDPTVAACLTEHARQLRFPAPAPSGVVDVHLPLHLAPENPPTQRAYCE